MAFLDNFWWFFPLYRMSRWLSPTSFWSYLFCQHPTYFSPLDLWSQNESCTCQGKIYEKKGEDTRKKGSSYFWRDEHSVLKWPQKCEFLSARIAASLDLLFSSLTIWVAKINGIFLFQIFLNYSKYIRTIPNILEIFKIDKL